MEISAYLLSINPRMILGPLPYRQAGQISGHIGHDQVCHCRSDIYVLERRTRDDDDDDYDDDDELIPMMAGL